VSFTRFEKQELNKTIKQFEILSGSTIADAGAIETEATGDIADHMNLTQFVHIAKESLEQFCLALLRPRGALMRHSRALITQSRA
jgi:hypothetical protein